MHCASIVSLCAKRDLRLQFLACLWLGLDWRRAAMHVWSLEDYWDSKKRNKTWRCWQPGRLLSMMSKRIGSGLNTPMQVCFMLPLWILLIDVLWTVFVMVKLERWTDNAMYCSWGWIFTRSLILMWPIFLFVDGDGRLTGNDAVKFFSLSALPRQELKQVCVLLLKILKLCQFRAP